MAHGGNGTSFERLAWPRGCQAGPTLRLLPLLPPAREDHCCSQPSSVPVPFPADSCSPAYPSSVVTPVCFPNAPPRPPHHTPHSASCHLLNCTVIAHLSCLPRMPNSPSWARY